MSVLTRPLSFLISSSPETLINPPDSLNYRRCKAGTDYYTGNEFTNLSVHEESCLMMICEWYVPLRLRLTLLKSYYLS